MLEITEADDDDGDVVEGPPKQRVLENVLHAHSAELMHILSLAFHILMVLIVVSSLPNAHDRVAI